MFRHALLRDAAYSLQLPAQRAALHLLAADLIDQVAGDIGEAAGEIADHLKAARDLADRPGLENREREYASRAAGRASRAYMLPEARRRWLRVAEISQGPEACNAWLEAGAAARALGDRRQFEEAATCALEIARAGTDRSQLCEALEHTANMAFDRGDFAAAAAITDEALSIATEHGDARHEVGLLVNQALNFLEMGRLEDSAEIFRRLMPRLSSDEEATAHASINYAMLLDRQGKPEEALQRFRRALEIDRKLGLVDGEAGALNHLGNMAWKAQKLDEADGYYAQALVLARRLGDPHHQALTLSNLGLLRQDQGRVQESLAVLQEAVALCEEFAIASLHATAVSNLGFTYRALQQLERAEDCIARSAEICLRYGDRAGHAIAMGNLASIYSGREELERALEVFESVLPVERELSEWRFLGNHQCEYSMVLARLSRLDAAREHWSQGYPLLLEFGTASEIPKRLARMQGVCAALGIPAFRTEV